MQEYHSILKVRRIVRAVLTYLLSVTGLVIFMLIIVLW